MRKTWQERWWVKVAKGSEDECWLFIGSLRRGGYGVFWDGVRNVAAHRWSYANFVGEIPEGLDVLHRCDNPPCVNPAHLWVGTHATNMADASAKGRFGGPNAGGRHLASRKNDWDRVAEIRRRYRAGESRRELAKEYDLEYSTVRKIARGAMWPEEAAPAVGRAREDQALYDTRKRDIVVR